MLDSKFNWWALGPTACNYIELKEFQFNPHTQKMQGFSLPYNITK